MTGFGVSACVWRPVVEHFKHEKVDGMIYWTPRVSNIQRQ